MGLALCEGGERSERIMGLLQRICLRPIVAQTNSDRARVTRWATELGRDFNSDKQG